MNRTSLKTLILDYLKLRYPDWVLGGIIEELTSGYGYKASNGSRRARELENDGSIVSDYYRGARGEKLVKYRFKMPQEENKIRELLKETGRMRIEIVTMPNGERRAKEVLI